MPLIVISDLASDYDWDLDGEPDGLAVDAGLACPYNDEWMACDYLYDADGVMISTACTYEEGSYTCELTADDLYVCTDIWYGETCVYTYDRDWYYIGSTCEGSECLAAECCTTDAYCQEVFGPDSACWDGYCNAGLVCEDGPDYYYVGIGEECMLIDYACAEGEVMFDDYCGCGCYVEPGECWGAWTDETGQCRAPNDGVYPDECCDTFFP